MKLKKIIRFGNYIFKNYTILNNDEQKIALEFRNKNRKWMINTNIIEMKEHKKWLKKLEDRVDLIYFLVFKDDIPFMAIDYHDIDFEKREAYWGYFLGDDNYKSEVLKIEKIIIDIAFNNLKIKKLLCINKINNKVINIHKFFGFKEDEIIKINKKEFLKMYLSKDNR